MFRREEKRKTNNTVKGKWDTLCVLLYKPEKKIALCIVVGERRRRRKSKSRPHLDRPQPTPVLAQARVQVQAVRVRVQVVRAGR